MPRGYFPSLKNGRMVVFEHLLEKAALRLFEMSPFVRAYAAQPERIHYRDQDRVRRYTPDYEIETTDGQFILVEIKSKRQLARPNVRETLERISEHMTEVGRPYVVLTEDVIRLQPRFTNLGLLLRDRPLYCVTPDVMCSSLRRLMSESVKTLGHARLVVGSDVLFSLFTHGLATCPLDDAITDDTPITFSLEKDHAWFFISKKHGF